MEGSSEDPEMLHLSLCMQFYKGSNFLGGYLLDILDVVLPIRGGDFNTAEQVAIPPLSFTMSSIQSMWLATLVKMPGAD